MIIFKVTQLTILMKIQIEVSEAERANWVAGHVTTLISQGATIVHHCDDDYDENDKQGETFLNDGGDDEDDYE